MKPCLLHTAVVRIPILRRSKNNKAATMIAPTTLPIKTGLKYTPGSLSYRSIGTFIPKKADTTTAIVTAIVTVVVIILIYRIRLRRLSDFIFMSASAECN